MDPFAKLGLFFFDGKGYNRNQIPALRRAVLPRMLSAVLPVLQKQCGCAAAGTALRHSENTRRRISYGVLAQLVRAAGSYPAGPGFEPLRPHHNDEIRTVMVRILYF